MNDLKRKWAKAVLSPVLGEGRPAKLGKEDGTIYWVDDGGNTRGDTVWVRYVVSPGEMAEIPVRNSGLPASPGLPVLLVNRHGVLTAVVDKFGGSMHNFTGGGGWLPLEQHGITHRRLGIDPRLVEGLSFEPGMVRPTNPAGMTVYVEPGAYKQTGDTTITFWQGGATGSLAAYVPVADTGAKHFVIICLDRATNALVIVDGDDYGTILGAVLTYDDIEAITIADDYHPLAAIELYYGQTKVTKWDIKFDTRYWLGEGSAAGTSTGSAAAIFTQTVDKTIADTVTETDLISAGRGSRTLAADLLEVGTVIRLSMAGYVSTTGTPNIEIAVTLGGTELATTGATALGSALSNVGWRMFLNITCRTAGATGTVVTSGFIRVGEDLPGMVKTTTTTINTTIAQLLEAPSTWGTADAANSITCQEVVVEHLAVTGLAPVGPSDLEAAETV